MRRHEQPDHTESTALPAIQNRATNSTDSRYQDRSSAKWIANLDEVATLEPAVVVAGHKKVENDNNPKIIGESQQYLRDFSQIAAEETTAAGIVARMVERYPDWQNLRTLWYSASTAVKRTSS